MPHCFSILGLYSQGEDINDAAGHVTAEFVDRLIVFRMKTELVGQKTESCIVSPNDTMQDYSTSGVTG